MQEQQQIQKQAMALEFRTKGAEASEAEADARKTAVEAAQAQFELAMQSGQINDAIGRIVQAEVARALQGAFQMGQPPAY